MIIRPQLIKNKFLILFIISAIFGCSSSSSVNDEKDSLNTIIPQKLESVAIDTSLPIVCIAPANVIVSDTVIDFTNTVFKYASKTDLEGCKFRLECDCCSSDLVFLNDSVFYLVDYCVEDASVIKGTYFITDGFLIIRSGNTSVHHLYNRSDMDDNSTNDYTVTDSIIKPFHIKFSIASCESGIKLIDNEEPQFLAIKTDNHPKTIISDLEEWGMMRRVRSLSKKN
jgi:hypothetical protein